MRHDDHHRTGTEKIEDEPSHHYEGDVDPHDEVVRLEAFAASFAVLRFEPRATMPPNNADTAVAIIPRSNRIAPTRASRRGQCRRPRSLSARPG